MQGYTSYPLRKLFHFLSRNLEEDDDERSTIVLWTEMEKCEDLLSSNQNGWEKRFGSPNGGKGKSSDSCILQLGGSDPDLVKQCIYQAAEYGYTPNDFGFVDGDAGDGSPEDFFDGSLGLEGLRWAADKVALGERPSTNIIGLICNCTYGCTFAEETTVEVVLASSAETKELAGILDVGLVVHGAILVNGHGKRSVLAQVGNL